MQTAREIRQLLAEADLRPLQRLGQNFLVDQNLLSRLLDLAELTGDETVLEVGPGTGSLTEELLARARRVVAVEIDHGLFALLRRRLGGREGLKLMRADVLSGKHRIDPGVLAALGGQADLVANLPYNVATPLLAECLLASWRRARGQGPTEGCLVRRMTVTVQQEVAERLVASPGGGEYGPVSVLVRLLGQISRGRAVPPTAFWPRPKVAGRMVRIDFVPPQAAALADADLLVEVLQLVFTQRRKQIGSAVRRRNPPFAPPVFRSALESAGIDPALRPDGIPPAGFLALANALADAGARPSPGP